MFHDIMNISCLMAHAQQVEKGILRKNNREAKKARCYYGRSSNGSLYIQDMPSFKKMFSNQCPYLFPKVRGDRVCNLKSEKRRGTS